jgi:hypothetical protein
MVSGGWLTPAAEPEPRPTLRGARVALAVGVAACVVTLALAVLGRLLVG